MSETIFSWLHLTDLHWDSDSYDNQLWPAVQAELLNDLEWMYDQCGPWDCVFFTGDLTKKGSVENFEGLNKPLKVLFEKLTELGSKPIFFAVPGNHDLVRPKLSRGELDSLLAWNKDNELRKAFWDETNNSYRKKITDAFQNYQHWYETSAPHRPDESKLTLGKLPGDFSYVFKKDSYKIGIVGLNSSFLHLKNEFTEGKLALDVRQINAICRNNTPEWANQNDVNILLTHHPSTWFSEWARDEFYEHIAPSGRFLIHLYGHLHEPQSIETRKGGGDKIHQLQGSSLFSMEKWSSSQKERRIHGYSGGRIYLDGKKASVEIWPRISNRTQDHRRLLGPDLSYSLDRWTLSFGKRVVTGKNLKPNQLVSPVKPAEEGVQRLDSQSDIELTIVDDPYEKKKPYNSEFYRKLINSIRNAQKGAIIVGHGFDFFGKESKHYANQYLRTICNTAERLHVYRIEFSRSGNRAWAEWIEMMANYLPFSDSNSTTGVTLLKPNKNFSLLKNCAVFDWISEEPFAVIMFPTAHNSKDLLGMKQDVRADAGIFIRHPRAVHTLYENLERIMFRQVEFGKEINTDNFKEIHNKEELIKEYLETDKIKKLESSWKDDTKLIKKPYFAYGSNINQSRASNRLLNVTKIGIATLMSHQIIFRNPSIPGIDSVATVEKHSDSNVIGVLYEMCVKDKRCLEFYEGVDDNVYEEKEVEVKVSNGEKSTIKAFTYVLRPGFNSGEPNYGYLLTIIDGLKYIKNESDESTRKKLDEYIIMMQRRFSLPS